MLPGWKLVDRLSPERSPFNFPNFRAAIGVFDTVALPVPLGEYGRISRKVTNAPAGISLTNSRYAARSSLFDRLRRVANDFRFLQPTVEITGNFANESLTKCVQVIQELRVSSIKFVKRPRADLDAIGECMLDLVDSDLGFGLKLNLLRNVVFFRRVASSAQLFGRYIRLSRRL